MKRISAFDTGKGIAVLGMIIAHTFEGGLCQWDVQVELDAIHHIPVFLIVLFSPVSLILLMGLFFTFISSITCCISVINKEKMGMRVVCMYIFYRMVYAILLKWIELVFSTWWRKFGIFETMTFQFPIVPIPQYSHTLDSVGVCGWLIPTLVVLVRKIPVHYKFPAYYLHVFLLALLSLLLLVFYNPIADGAMKVASFFHQHEMNALSLVFSKIGSGPFMLAQTIPFGIIGGVLAILISERNDCHELWIFDIVFTLVATVLSGVLFFCTSDFWEKVISEYKPPSLRLMELVVETNIIVLGIFLCEDPQRSLQQRTKLIRYGTFLRRISVISLTIFIFEQYICTVILKWFSLFAGMPYDLESKKYLWPIPLSLFYMVVTTTAELGIVRLWEYGSFRFSCEHFLVCILSWLFSRNRSVYVDYERIIYEPNYPSISSRTGLPRKRSISV